MDSRDFECLLAIEETKSLAQAAERLYISQPALSLSLKRMETSLGCELFVRERLGLKPTRAGELYLSFARDFLRREQEVQWQINNCSDLLVIGISPTWEPYICAKILPQLMDLHPGKELNIKRDLYDNFEKMLLDHEIDVSLITMPVSGTLNKRLDYAPLFNDEILLAVPSNSPLLLHAHPVQVGYPLIDISYLKDETFILAPEDTRLGKMSSDFLKKSRLTPNTILRCESIQARTILAALGKGITFVSRFFAETNITFYSPEYLSLGNSMDQPQIILAWRQSSSVNPYVMDFLNIAKDELGKYVESLK